MSEDPKHDVKVETASDTSPEPPLRQIPGVHVGPPSAEPELDTETPVSYTHLTLPTNREV